MENPHISGVHLLWEKTDPRKFLPDDILNDNEMMKKLVLTEVKRQPTYKQMFKYANEELERGSVAIITNAEACI